jgi:hypothetical protein
MKTLLGILASIALAATLLPSILVFSGAMEPGTHKTIMTAGMVLWFVTAPFIMKRKGST